MSDREDTRRLFGLACVLLVVALTAIVLLMVDVILIAYVTGAFVGVLGFFGMFALWEG